MTFTEFTPATVSELARFVEENAATRKETLCPVGGRTSMHFGFLPREPNCYVRMSELSRIIDYPARDMTITVEAGIRVDALQTALAAEGQRLPIDIAQSGRATLAGALVTNTSGPRRFGHGTFRDYVIGISAVDAFGRLFKAGGRVVKNVAGYDICKLLVGSRGTLGIVTQVTLKLRPLAESTALLWTPFDKIAELDRCLNRLLTSDARPIAIEVLNSAAAKQISSGARIELAATRPVLCLGVEGSLKDVHWQIETLRKEIAPFTSIQGTEINDAHARSLWSALTEFQTSAEEPLTFQANMRPSQCMAFVELATSHDIAVQVHAGTGVAIG
ncbi:MAG: FAD-binding oxidoreductase, partial [Planctomycetes bacterium]|nr:FAD-binding oxidoreductase [Planctomycetota bacterium]